MEFPQVRLSAMSSHYRGQLYMYDRCVSMGTVHSFYTEKETNKTHRSPIRENWFPMIKYIYRDGKLVCIQVWGI